MEHVSKLNIDTSHIKYIYRIMPLEPWLLPVVHSGRGKAAGRGRPLLLWRQCAMCVCTRMKCHVSQEYAGIYFPQLCLESLWWADLQVCKLQVYSRQFRSTRRWRTAEEDRRPPPVCSSTEQIASQTSASAALARVCCCVGADLFDDCDRSSVVKCVIPDLSVIIKQSDESSGSVCPRVGFVLPHWMTDCLWHYMEKTGGGENVKKKKHTQHDHTIFLVNLNLKNLFFCCNKICSPETWPTISQVFNGKSLRLQTL